MHDTRTDGLIKGRIFFREMIVISLSSSAVHTLVVFSGKGWSSNIEQHGLSLLTSYFYGPPWALDWDEPALSLQMLLPLALQKKLCAAILLVGTWYFVEFTRLDVFLWKKNAMMITNSNINYSLLSEIIQQTYHVEFAWSLPRAILIGAFDSSALQFNLSC